MYLQQVLDKNTAKEFLLFPLSIYKNDPNYIRPLDKDIEFVFDQEKNKYFRHGECVRWILKDDQGEVIGRIAAFINRKTLKSFEQPTGGVGFFECIENKEAAFKLLDTAKEWLSKKGMEAMDGPINFGDRDKWWGLLVDGFYPPCYCCNYNPKYYQTFFEEYGFEVFFKQYTYYRHLSWALSDTYMEKAQRILQNPDYTFEHMRIKNLPKYIEDFRTVYNKAWVKHMGVKEMTPAQAKVIMNQLKPVLDEKIVWYAYYKGECVGFYVNIPELNQLFKYVNGKLDLIGKLKFLYHKWKRSNKTMYGIVFGIAPEHQKKGVEAAMIVAAAEVLLDRKQVAYEDFQMNWIGDFNPKMMNVAEQIGGKIYKTHHTYRYLFDRTKEFKRHAIIG
ncbi:hypothetical protein Pedsa_2377 [Pseudopedobacter saltans DSM 12145]|uniref:N-acetyltransferase domain-containing protein n=1 Tax=Pseudopedobacter saltans (strain ATCC 51119 / DSM 12145 / JCM 21818 / CCUG 39354 / LMG 10337 / NBRC 100064 / NCIMB 13643) TaxID=762903 RepID=F0SDZ9_PSESL|nr:hypothetical protein [Pseudopedobacter saltans]ADY52925.1 hypothetical protein Pedsa_2377 [Pseudopedobacter saltans DSM 12145]